MNLTAWWQGRTRREQSVLMGGLVILLLVAVYLVVEPMVQERGELSDAIPELRADLTWMQAHSDEMRVFLENTSQGNNPGNQALSLSAVQTTLREFGLLDLVDDLRGTTQGGISLNITDVAFSDLVEFLYIIRSRFQGRVETAEINRNNETEGVVSAQIVLREGGS